MIEVEHRFTLPTPPEKAFEFLAQPENDPLWQASCRSAVLQDAPCGLGSRYDIVFDFLGRHMRFSCEVTAFDPARAYGFKVREGSFHYAAHYDFDTFGDGQALVHWRFSAEPGAFFGLVPVAILRKVVLSQYERDVATLKALVARQAG